MEELPDSLLEALRKVHDLGKLQNDSGSSSLEFLLGSTKDISRRTEMMKFLRNATLLCLTAFPRNYILEEAALVAEELSVTQMNSNSSSVTPCRTLAKRLLKADRQVNGVTFFLIALMCMHHIPTCNDLVFSICFFE